jgi:hypothetical protein
MLAAPPPPPRAASSSFPDCLSNDNTYNTSSQYLFYSVILPNGLWVKTEDSLLPLCSHARPEPKLVWSNTAVLSFHEYFPQNLDYHAAQHSHFSTFLMSFMSPVIHINTSLTHTTSQPLDGIINHPFSKTAPRVTMSDRCHPYAVTAIFLSFYIGFIISHSFH